MNDGVGRHYRDDAGAAYFDWQESIGELGGKLNARKFTGYVSPADTLIDFGCGTGALLEHLDAREKIGIEPNRTARERVSERGIRCVSSPGDLDHDCADVVVSNHALEHALNPYGELLEIRRILKPGGRLVLYLPLNDFRSDFDPADDPNHHLYTWTPLLIHNLLAEAGFEVVETSLVTHAWSPRFAFLAKLPGPLFDMASYVWSVLRRRRQVRAIASVNPQHDPETQTK